METLKIQNGIIVIGEACIGKTTIIKALKYSIN